MSNNAVKLTYGEQPDQHVEWLQQDSSRAAIVLVHGGYWPAKYDASLMDPLVEKFHAAGWDVFNVEYRRGEEVGFDELLADTNAAFATVREAVDGKYPIASIGHSVGGQIVLLNAGAVDAVVGLAPVTNVVRVRDEKLGNEAVKEFWGEELVEQDGLLRTASPLHNLPKSSVVPILVVQGQNDTAVPPGHTEVYVRTAVDAGVNVDTFMLRDCPHMDIIEPDANHWEFTLPWLEQRLNLKA